MALELGKDRTMEDVSAYGSDKWCAARLGQSLNWFKKNRPILEHEGFPSKDRLFGLTLKADVEAFLAKRRRMADPDPAAQPPKSGGIRYDRL
jgi:hypothetical protein